MGMGLNSQYRGQIGSAALAALAVVFVLAASASAAQARQPQRGSGEARIAVAGARAVAPVRRNVCGITLRKRHREARRHWRKRRARISRRCRRMVRRGAEASRYPPSPIYWGAWIGEQLTGGQAPWDMSAVSAFEGMADKKLSIIHYSAPFANCSSSCSNYDFPTGPMQMIRDHGSIPLYSWASQSTPSKLSEPDFELSDVIAGNHDSFIREFATDAATWGHPFFLRFNWEMNGDWFPWSEGVNGNKAGEYVAAWRHVHDIFASVGATNATWVWCPMADPAGKFQDIGSLYPGDEYVDWTCLDSYNWGTNPGAPSSRLGFKSLIGPTYRQIVDSVAPSKPLLIGEVGASERGGAKAGWISEMLDSAASEFPAIKGVVWFEKYDDGMDWPIETSSAATNAFATSIQSPVYMGNHYAGIDTSPIPPPS